MYTKQYNTVKKFSTFRKTISKIRFYCETLGLNKIRATADLIRKQTGEKVTFSVRT